MKRKSAISRRGQANGWLVLIVILALMAGVVGLVVMKKQASAERGPVPTTQSWD